MTQKIVGRKAVLALKEQSAAGVWSTPTAASDAIKVRNPEITFDPQLTQTDEVSASLGQAAQLVGGMKVGINGGIYLKGPGVPGVLPEYDPLLQIGGLQPTTTRTDITGTDISFTASGAKIAGATTDLAALTAGTVIYISGAANDANNGEFIVTTATLATTNDELALTKLDGSAAGLVDESAGATITIARGIAGVAATAGTAISLTAQSPWSNTAQVYRHMPVVVSGNPSTPAHSQIINYTSGRVASLYDTFSPVLANTTKASIPPHILYLLASLDLPWASGVLWMDGRRFQVRDLVASSLRITGTAAGVWTLDFTLQGILYADPDDEALPTPTYDGTKPGIWRKSKFRLDRSATSLETLQLNIENTVTFPADPNEDEGFQAPIVTARKVTGSIDPHLTLAATRDAVTQLKAGSTHNFHATLKGGQASTPGTRVGLGVPEASYIGVSYPDAGGIKKEMINFECDGLSDNEFGLFIR